MAFEAPWSEGHREDVRTVNIQDQSERGPDFISIFGCHFAAGLTILIIYIYIYIYIITSYT